MTPNTKQIQSIERIQSFAMHPLETEKASTTGQRKRDNPIVSPIKAYWQTDTDQQFSQNRSQHKSRSQSSKLTKHSNITSTFYNLHSIHISGIYTNFHPEHRWIIPIQFLFRSPPLLRHLRPHPHPRHHLHLLLRHHPHRHPNRRRHPVYPDIR